MLLATIPKDTLPLICMHLRSTKHLGMLACAHPTFRAAIPWLEHARRLCGTWPASQPHADDDPRYVAMLSLCPWLSVPQNLEMGIESATGQRVRVLGMVGWGPEHMLTDVDVTDSEGGVQFNAFVVTTSRSHRRPHSVEFVTPCIDDDMQQLPPAFMSDEERALHLRATATLLPVEYADYDESRAFKIHEAAFALAMVNYDVKASSTILIFATATGELLRVFDSLAPDQYHVMVAPGLESLVEGFC